MKKIVLGADAVGLLLKDEIVKFLQDEGYEVTDLGVKDENDKKKIKKIIDLLNENFDLSNAKIMKEYQFKDEEINLSVVIDLLLIFDKKAAILDYKVKNIDDEHYIYQLEKYKSYIKKAFNFDDVETYLISIIDTKIKKIVID